MTPPSPHPDDDGYCNAADPDNIGWFKAYDSEDSEGYYDFQAYQGSGEVFLPPWAKQADVTSVEDEVPASTSTHTEATAVVAVGAVLTVAVSGREDVPPSLSIGPRP